MELRLVPAADAETLGAVVAAVARAGLDLDELPPAYASAWRVAAVAEGVRRPLGDDDRPGGWAPTTPL
jgi:hypothetical protein